MRVQLSSVVRLTLWLCLPLILMLGSAPAAPAAGGLAAVQSDLAGQLRAAGPYDGAYVYDLTAHRVLFSERASTMRPPASVEKLYTATALLERLGPEYRLSTTVYGAGHLAPGGVWEGSLYLHGGGDPTFGSSAFVAGHYGGVGSPVSALAGQLRAAGIRRVSGKWWATNRCSTASAASPPAATPPTPSWKARSAPWPSTGGPPAANRGPTPPPPTPRASCGRRCGPTGST